MIPVRGPQTLFLKLLCCGLFAVELFPPQYVDTMMPASGVAFAWACAPRAIRNR